MRSETESSPLEVSKTTKPPRLILEGLYAFSPNRETLGGTSYLIVENTGNILVDCPSCEESERDFLREKGVRYLFFTHRAGQGKQSDSLQSLLNCEIILQEQEAYLLPHRQITVFQQQIQLSPTCSGFWTPVADWIFVRDLSCLDPVGDGTATCPWQKHQNRGRDLASQKPCRIPVFCIYRLVGCLLYTSRRG